MELQDAKAIFNIQGKYTLDDLDNFYNFEKNLLLQKLEQESSDDELMQVQKSLSDLERAYSLLSIKLGDAATMPAADEDDFEDEEDPEAKKKKMAAIAVVGVAVAAGAWFFFGQQQTAPVNQDTTPAPAVTKKAPTSPETRGNPQLEAMKVMEIQLADLEQEWEELVAGHGFAQPESFSSLRKEALEFRKLNRYNQALHTYNQLEHQIETRIRRVKSYLDIFERFDKLTNTWNEVAKQHNFQFPEQSIYERKFTETKTSLKSGRYPFHTLASLDAICFRYKTVLEMSDKILAQRKEFDDFKKLWEGNILNSSYYTLTPSMERLIKQVEGSIKTSDFEYIHTQVYPRILNHFKQHETQR